MMPAVIILRMIIVTMGDIEDCDQRSGHSMLMMIDDHGDGDDDDDAWWWWWL